MSRPQQLPFATIVRCLRCTRPVGPSRSSIKQEGLPFSRTYSQFSHLHNTRRGYVALASALCGLLAAGSVLTYSSLPRQLDAAPSTSGEALTSGAKVQVTGKDHGEDVTRVSTGTSTVPYFPRSIWLPKKDDPSDVGRSLALPAGIGALSEEEEYQLLGLGVRKVSLFRIEVYVVGIYVAKSDLSKLQQGLVKASVGSGASALVKGEKDDLRKTLLDGKGSEKVWNELLQNGDFDSAVRIVPVKNTNFSHLRDGWIRGIDARGKGPGFDDEGFRTAVADFKAMMGGQGSVGKGRVLLLGRSKNGGLSAWVEEGAKTAVQTQDGPLVLHGDRMHELGSVTDERISRLVWLGYISGASPASEDARASVVEGVIDIVERPIGSVETQVL